MFENHIFPFRHFDIQLSQLFLLYNAIYFEFCFWRGWGGGVSEFGCKRKGKGKGRFILVTFASGGVLPLWAYYAIDYPIQALPLNISNFHGALGNFKPCLIKIHCRRNQDSE